MEVIPAINCEIWECVEEYLEKSREFGVSWVHFDVSDGKFNDVITWNEPHTLFESYELQVASLNIEAHLMVEDVWKYAEQWRGVAKRILVHVDKVESCKLRVESFADVELGLVVGSETAVEEVFPYLDRVRFVQLLAVSPGRSGQGFNKVTLEKIRVLREEDADVIIEVDGGMDDETAPLAYAAGANIAVSSSFIWNHASPKDALWTLQQIGT